MIKKLIKAKFKLETFWLSWVFVFFALIGMSTQPLTMLYGCMLPTFISRDNRQHELYLQLPVKRTDVIKSNVIFIAIWQAIYVALFCLGMLWGRFVYDGVKYIYENWYLRQNLTQLGILLIGMGLYNVLYENTTVMQIVTSVVILALPASLNTLACRYGAKYFDGYGIQYLWVRLASFATGLVTYCYLTLLSYKRKVRKNDIANDIYRN